MIIHPETQTVKDTYKLLMGSIVPRPIAFVSTVSADGIPNLAPFSFFTGITSQPPTVGFAPSRKGSAGDRKDTLANIEATGEFVVNVVTLEIVEPMNATAVDFPPEVNEFTEVGLTPIPSDRVSAPRVAESPINMECKLHQIVPVGVKGPGGGFFVIGEVVAFHVADDLFNEGRIDVERLNPVGRLAGKAYTTLGKSFILER